MQQISDLRAMASHVTSFMGGEPVSHTRNVTGMQNTVAKIIEEEARLNREIDQLVDVKQEIGKVIAEVQDVNLRLILEKRYLLFEYWEKIAADLGYTERWARDRNKLALRVVDRIRFALFAGTDKTSTMYSVREFGNTCLLYSLDDVLRYGDLLNIPQADERNRIVERKEIPLFNQEAYREAVINAFVHNSWIDGNAPMLLSEQQLLHIFLEL